MKSIRPLIEDLPANERSREFDAYTRLADRIKLLEDKVKKLGSLNLKYFVRAYRNIDQTLNPGTTVIALTNTEYPQFGNMHDNVNDNNYIFIRRSGVYTLAAAIQWAANATGTFRQVAIRLLRGGVTTVLVSQRAAVNAALLTQDCGCDWYCYLNDRIEMVGVHDAGVAINVTANNPQSPFLSVTERMEDLKIEDLGLLDPGLNTR